MAIKKINIVLSALVDTDLDSIYDVVSNLDIKVSEGSENVSIKKYEIDNFFEV